MTEINPGMNWPAQHCQTKRVNVVRRLILHSHREGDVTRGDTGSLGPDSYRMGRGFLGLGALRGWGFKTVHMGCELSSRCDKVLDNSGADSRGGQSEPEHRSALPHCSLARQHHHSVHHVLHSCSLCVFWCGRPSFSSVPSNRLPFLNSAPHV